MKITWDEQTCIHSGNCVQSLPKVFKVEEGRLVVALDAALEDAIRKVVVACPSGALKIAED